MTTTGLDRSSLEGRFSAAPVWWLATASVADGPHTVPVWGVVVDGILCSYADPGARRVRDLASDPRAVLHLESGSDVLIVRGTCTIGGPVVERPDVVAAYASKYTAPEDAPFLPGAPEMDGVVLLELRPTSAQAWNLADFFGSQQRWRA